MNHSYNDYKNEQGVFHPVNEWFYEYFDEVDRDGNGQISATELKLMHEPQWEPSGEEIIMNYDLNGDGVLNYEEAY